jgi:hypothetical protein
MLFVKNRILVKGQKIMQVNHQRQSFLILIFVILFAVGPAYCSTYFIDPNGNDTTGTGSIDSPWKTIPKAAGLVVAGDTIYVRGGTHVYTTTINLDKSGTSIAKINLLAYNGEHSILDFSSMALNSSNRGIKVTGSYWYIKGLNIYRAGDNGMWMSGSYNIIEFCTFYENQDAGLQMDAGAAHEQIINCDSYYNYDAATSGGNADGFSPKLGVGTDIYFYGCRSWQNSDDGYDGYLRGSDNVDVTYENCWAFKNGYLKDGVTPAGNGNGFKMGGCDADANGQKHLRHNATLKNCLSFQNLSKGFDQNSDKGSMTLINCTAFNNVGNNFSISTSPLEPGKTASVTNSLYLTGGNSLGSFVVQTTNGWQSPFSVTSADFITIDPTQAYAPRKADGSLPDISFMHLAAGSDLIDGGTNAGLPYNGLGPDLGYFEYYAADTNETTPPAPNPAMWNLIPSIVNSSSITMSAIPVGDATGPVQYYFECTTDDSYSSGWQTSATYTATGLAQNTSYSFRVKAKDNATIPNETGWSSTKSATTALIPLFVAAGTAASGTGTITPALPSGIAVNDILLLFLETANQAITIPTPNGGTWTEVTGSPQGTGTAGSSTSTTRLTVFWSRYNGTQGAPTTSDSGDHQFGQILAFRNATSSGNPWDVTAGGIKAATSYSTTCEAVTTTVDNTLIVLAASRDNDSTATAWGNWTNANLTILTEQTDGGTTSGNGGGIGVATGFKLTAGNTGQTTGALLTTTVDGHITIALKPESASNPAAPTGLTATAGYIPVRLDWNNNSEGDLAGYNVYRSTTSGSGYSKLNSTLLTDSNYIDDINTTDITYYYVVTAVNTTSNESTYSGQVFSGLYGDFTGNKIVKLDDLAEFATYWLLENCTETAGVDLNGDCVVNFDEFAAFADNWMK